MNVCKFISALFFLFSCVKPVEKYEYFPSGEVSVYYNLDETKGDGWKKEFYSNGNLARVYRKDGFEEYYDENGNLVLVYDDLDEKYMTFDRNLASGKFEFHCRNNLGKICDTLVLRDGVLVKD